MCSGLRRNIPPQPHLNTWSQLVALFAAGLADATLLEEGIYIYHCGLI